jgi:hypothetical protein
MFGLRDVFMVKRLQPQGVAFDLRRLLLHSSSPLRSALAGYLTNHHLGTITCVHHEESAAAGPHSRANTAHALAQTWPRADEAEWDLAFLAPSLEYQANAPTLWLRLLSDLVVLGAAENIQRIYVRSSEDAEAEDIFRQVGFTIITREEVFALPREPVPAPLPKGLRRITPQDRPALDEFYAQVVPKLVQQAEGSAPHWWAARERMRPVAAREYVWAERGRLIAYLGLCSSARGYWLETAVRPEHRADLLPYLKYMLTLTRCSSAAPVYCPVPDYCVGIGWLLRTMGFEPYARQVLMVVHTAARVPVRRQMLVPGLERSVDIGTTVGHVCQRKP